MEADVPFAPHLAVVLKACGQATVQFTAKPVKQEKGAGKSVSVVNLPGATSQDPLDLSWAAFTSEAEAGMFDPNQSGRTAELGFSLLYPCFKTALCYGVVSGCFVHGVSPSPWFRPELAPERGLGGRGLAFRTPESARKIHAKSFGP